MKRFRGLANFIFDMVDETTRLTERTHMKVTDRSVRYVPPVDPVASSAREIGNAQKAIARGVYEAIRDVNEGARTAFGVVTDQVATLTSGAFAPVEHDALRKATWTADQLQALANGVAGDYLRRQGNGLEIAAHFRANDSALEPTREAILEAFPEPTSKVCVLVHGLACTEWSWNIRSEEFYGDASLDFGARLQRDCDYTPIYVRYNTGRHIADNGAELATMLEELIDAYPVDVSELVLLGHSMGGLVIRSAVQRAASDDARWVKSLDRVFCIGSPHHGSPLEKGANAAAKVLSRIDTAATQVIGELLETRSDGIKDLRHGYTADEDWEGCAPDPFQVDGVTYYSLAATIRQPGDLASEVLGDWLVRLPSATGQSEDEHVPFHETKVFANMDHVALANHPDVYAAVRDWLRTTSDAD